MKIFVLPVCFLLSSLFSMIYIKKVMSTSPVVYNLLSYSMKDCAGEIVTTQGWVLDYCVSGSSWSYFYNKTYSVSDGLGLNQYSFKTPNCQGTATNVTSILSYWYDVGVCFNTNNPSDPYLSQFLSINSTSLYIPNQAGFYEYSYDTSSDCSSTTQNYVSLFYDANDVCLEKTKWNCSETSNTGTVIQYQLPNCQGSSTVQPVADSNLCSGSPNHLYARAGCAPSGAFTSPSTAPTTSSASSDSSSSSSGPSAGVIAGAVIGTLAGVAMIAGIVYLVMFTNYFTAQKPLAAQSEKATEITA